MTKILAFRIRLAVVLLVPLLVLAEGEPASEDGDPEALALLRKSEALMRGHGTDGRYRVHIVRPDWQRTLLLRSIDDARNDRYRLEMLKPRKVKGTVFLKKEGKLTMYLPKLRREIAISPAMMHDPWMGSDFNNQDLLESSALIDQYAHRIVHQEGEGDNAVFTIESTPKPGAAVSWVQLLQRVRADGLPLEIQYNCKSDERRRVMRFEAPKKMGGRVIPSRWVMQPMAHPNQHTLIEVQEISFGFEPDDALFNGGGSSSKEREDR